MIMTIAIDGRCLQGGRGGVDIYVRSLLDKLFHVGNHHRFIIFFNGLQPFNHGIDMPSNVRCITTRVPSKLFHCAQFFLHRPHIDQWIRRFAQEPIDILFAPNLHFFSTSTNACTVVTVHDLSFVHYQHYMRLRSRLWHQCARIDSFVNYAERIIAVSKSTRNDLEQQGVAHDRISVIPLGINERFFGDSETERLPYILAFCPQERRKNIHMLVSAFARSREMCLEARNVKLVIGGIHGSLAKEMNRSIDKYDLRDAVRFIPYVSAECRIRLIRSCSLLAYPSIYEGFGMPPLEACASGIPAIVGAHSSIMEVCEDAVWYADPYSSEQWARAISYCLSSDQYRTSVRMTGPQQARKYSWQTCAQATLDLFEYVYANRN